MDCNCNDKNNDKGLNSNLSRMKIIYLFYLNEITKYKISLESVKYRKIKICIYNKKFIVSGRNSKRSLFEKFNCDVKAIFNYNDKLSININDLPENIQDNIYRVIDNNKNDAIYYQKLFFGIEVNKVSVCTYTIPQNMKPERGFTYEELKNIKNDLNLYQVGSKKNINFSKDLKALSFTDKFHNHHINRK
jgi:hypothetical protein